MLPLLIVVLHVLFGVLARPSILSGMLRGARRSRVLIAVALVAGLVPGAAAAEPDPTAVVSKRPRPTASAPT